MIDACDRRRISRGKPSRNESILPRGNSEVTLAARGKDERETEVRVRKRERRWKGNAKLQALLLTRKRNNSHRNANRPGTQNAPFLAYDRINGHLCFSRRTKPQEALCPIFARGTARAPVNVASLEITMGDKTICAAGGPEMETTAGVGERRQLARVYTTALCSRRPHRAVSSRGERFYLFGHLARSPFLSFFSFHRSLLSLLPCQKSSARVSPLNEILRYRTADDGSFMRFYIDFIVEMRSVITSPITVPATLIKRLPERRAFNGSRTKSVGKVRRGSRNFSISVTSKSVQLLRRFTFKRNRFKILDGLVKYLK
ncbi:hypothetical protein PUN28_003816 [Cardiocondyla obscurior]|uniref:Uncharacterized protein n=1 Tax=Cardiocondyla obscurior TaxID=286306 RepID=A0AAW2GP70_9HYME